MIAGPKQQIAAAPETQARRRFINTGSAGRIRTYDQVVNSHPLCQLSYRGMNKYSNEKSGKNQIHPAAADD